MMISSLIRFGRRQLHTIVSTELIKPSFPTPSHLKTYNLSVVDQFVPSTFIPLITFYPKTDIYHRSHNQILDLKNSLSQTITKHYPLAGRYARITPTYVDCNDCGVEFVEASIDSTLLDFLENSRHEDLDQFFPCGRIWGYLNSSAHDLESDTVSPLAVKVNHFDCGGVALAVSLSHKIADACSLIHFLSDWAKLTRVCSKKDKYEVPIEPKFISFEHTNIKLPELSNDVSKDCVTKSFIFPNAKLNELKLKVTSLMTSGSEQHTTNPTRVEVLTWLLYKRAIAAATVSNSGSFKPSCISHPANIRDKITEPLPGNYIGNLVLGMRVHTRNEMELKPGLFIGELRKQKMKIRGLKNLEAYFSMVTNMFSDFNSEERETTEDVFIISSLCGYPAYGIDFGWGTPIKSTFAGNQMKNSFLLMDAPNKEGIEVLVCLEKQEMDIIQRDLELLAFC